MEKITKPGSPENEGIDRRSFISKTTLAAIGTIGASNLIASCSREPRRKIIKLPVLLTQAPDGLLLKAGLIGCGGRGTGAAINYLDAGPNLQITALGDVFQDKLDQCRAQLKKEKNLDIADDKCFIGFDAFEKVIDSGVDVVLLCTPPHFDPHARLQSLEVAYDGKPIAVDPVGARRVMVAKRAQRGLA
jgi:hypothetical protein